MAVKIKEILIRFIVTLLKINIKNALATRIESLIQIIAMILNNFFMRWALFKNQVTINSWNFSDLVLMNGIMLFSYTIFAICASGLGYLSQYVNNGNLDIFYFLQKTYYL